MERGASPRGVAAVRAERGASPRACGLAAVRAECGVSLASPFYGQMAYKRKICNEHVVNSVSVQVGEHGKLFRFEDLKDDENVILMLAHLEMMQKFVHFCKDKKMKYAPGNPGKININLDEGNQQASNRTSFKDKISSYFGEYLPSNVVDQLCQLVDENSYGKCHYCSLPAESLVLSVLQILLDASHTLGKKSCSSQVLSQNLNNEAYNSNHCSNTSIPSNNHTTNDCVNEKAPPSPVAEEPLVTNIDKRKQTAFEGSTIKFNKMNAKSLPVLDTPVFLVGNKFNRNSVLPSQQAPVLLINPKSKPNRYIAGLRVASSMPSVAPNENANPEETKPKVSSLDLGTLADQLYNKKNVNINHAAKDQKHLLQSEASQRFKVSEDELKYYNILCGLAYSPWSCLEGVQLFKTSVTYNSLGESIEPYGHVDNFFIAGYCRKLFDDSHPRESRKHYFYPRIGGCLLSYKSVYEANTIKNSFLGANSALKLHLADKLCFPICKDDHWFAFIVDLRVKSFVFMDSLYPENHSYQIHARQCLIPAFKECWYEHSEVKLDLEDFSIMYPAVPKQDNCDDCGIFTIMFMEFWDVSIDLRRVFSQSDILNIRVKLGNAPFFSKKNTVDKTLVQNFFEQGIDPRLCD